MAVLTASTDAAGTIVCASVGALIVGSEMGFDTTAETATGFRMIDGVAPDRSVFVDELLSMEAPEMCEFGSKVEWVDDDWSDFKPSWVTVLKPMPDTVSSESPAVVSMTCRGNSKDFLGFFDPG